MTAMSKAKRESFLSDVHVAVVAIPREGQGPLTTPVWYWYCLLYTSDAADDVSTV